MSSKSLCDRCKHRWSRAGKFYCNNGLNCQYSKSKKYCYSFEEGINDKYWRGKSGKNRKGKCW